MGVIKHLSDFLRMLPIPCRVSYLPLLHDILHSTNPFNWRLRQCLAVQLPALLLLPPPELVFSTLFPLVMTLLQDPVATVRRDSFKGVAKMVMILSEQAEKLPKDILSNSDRISILQNSDQRSEEKFDFKDFDEERERNLSQEQYQNTGIRYMFSFYCFFVLFLTHSLVCFISLILSFFDCLNCPFKK